MGAIGGLIGTAGGASGSGFSGPSTVDITSPVSPEQLEASKYGVGKSLNTSDALLSALAVNNPVANQQNTAVAGNNLYGALAGVNGTGAMGTAMGQQNNLNGALSNAGGIGMQIGGARGLQNVLAQQQETAKQLQGIANGTGPNPAQAMLNNATGANVANQAALMAGQRGAGANVGLMARQAAQQGAATQQQAAGQAALMQAQQQLAAINASGTQQAGMANTNQAISGIGAGLTGQQQQGISQQYGQGIGAVGQMGDVLKTNAGIAQNQVGNLMEGVKTNVQGNLNNAGQDITAAGQYNATQVGQQGNVNTNNAGLAGNAMTGQRDIVGGALKGIAGGLYSMAGGGGGGAGGAASGITQSWEAPELAGLMAHGGQVEESTHHSSFGRFLHQSTHGQAMAQGGGAVAANNPAQKAVKPGDSMANDKVKTVLSEGEIVIPRSVTMSKDPVRGSADFVRKVIAKRRAGK